MHARLKQLPTLGKPAGGQAEPGAAPEPGLAGAPGLAAFLVPVPEATEVFKLTFQ